MFSYNKKRLMIMILMKYHININSIIIKDKLIFSF